MRNIIVSIVMLCLLMTGCNSRTPQYRIGVSQCLDDAWRQKMNYEMERELLLHPDMTLSRRIAYGSNELQCAQIDSFIRERVDLLIVSPNEAEQVQPAVTRAYRAGIPVIVADRRVPGDEWTAFIGGDNYKVGRLMAQWVIGKASDKGSKAKRKPFVVLEVAGLPGSTPATLRHKGMMEGIEEANGEDGTRRMPMRLSLLIWRITPCLMLSWRITTLWLSGLPRRFLPFLSWAWMASIRACRLS